ncbi:hypothetical protein PoB_000883900 [Plakobranchus ocellatus]|uniref:Uncharacterized protein n=1 Tax=Plakobranchus ocellatus TaxID=259542 RepID=A0AAV3YH50_9GAST|nr:hypothetical protein PoB_000883900 [Plakobranchus ocellatus]
MNGHWQQARVLKLQYEIHVRSHGNQPEYLRFNKYIQCGHLAANTSVRAFPCGHVAASTRAQASNICPFEVSLNSICQYLKFDSPHLMINSKHGNDNDVVNILRAILKRCVRDKMENQNLFVDP